MAKKRVFARTLHFKSREAKKNHDAYALKEYTTKRYKDGKIVCNCPGFIHHGHCWHVERLSQIK